MRRRKKNTQKYFSWSDSTNACHSVRFKLQFCFPITIKFRFFLRMWKILETFRWKVQCFPHIRIHTQTQTRLFSPTRFKIVFSKFQMHVIISFIIIFFCYYWTNNEQMNKWNYWKLLWNCWIRFKENIWNAGDDDSKWFRKIK